MKSARRHHYVQARYLEGFLLPPGERLWCYGRRKQSPFQKIPDDLAYQRDFYRFPNAPPEQNLERFLEVNVERPGLSGLRKLVGTKVPLDVEDRIYLARYIAFQEMRVPLTREVNREHISHSVNHMLKQFQDTGGDSARVQHVALVEGAEAKRSEPFSVRREDIEAYAREIADNPESFDLQSMVDLANDMTTFYASMR